jgi:hypothetical protein
MQKRNIRMRCGVVASLFCGNFEHGRPMVGGERPAAAGKRLQANNWFV